MRHLGGPLLGRLSGARTIGVGFGILLVGALPLGLYILFGPADGNPIGLGLLAVVSVPAGSIVVVIGLIKAAVEYLSNRGGR